MDNERTLANILLLEVEFPKGMIAAQQFLTNVEIKIENIIDGFESKKSDQYTV